MEILSVVGIGPGNSGQMTMEAREMISGAERIVAYQLYADLIRDQFPDKQYYTTGMGGEADRVRYAVDSAVKGIRTVVVCSGDAEIYGMAPLVFQIALEQGMDLKKIRIVPGITAALSCGAILGSPLSCDFAVVSLSDLLQSWERIRNRLEGAARGGLPLVLYNPGSRKRKGYLRRACEIVLKYRKPETVCGIVREAGRDGQSCRLLTLAELSEEEADMFATVFIGSEDTRVMGGRMVAPRGYENKYKLRENALTGFENTVLDEDDRTSVEERSLNGDSGSGKREILIFGGTTEGRLLAQAAGEAGYETTLSVVSEYGREIAELAGRGIRILTGVMPEEEIRDLLSSGSFCCVVDATHPYAVHISGSIGRASEAEGIHRIRVDRCTDSTFGSKNGIDEYEAGSFPDSYSAVFPDMKSVIDYLNGQVGTVFFATGSKAAEDYACLRNLKNRAWIRILPSEEALSKVRSAGFQRSHIICMQGPFSEEMNMAFFRSAGAEWLVTKSSGKEGGFDSKISAARKLGMKILLIRPPEYGEETAAFSYDEVLRMIMERRL